MNAQPPRGRAPSRIALLGAVARAVWRGALYKVTLAVNDTCNSRCLTCDIWKDRNPPPGTHRDVLATAEILDTLGRLPPSVCWFSVTGGEPHLRADLPEIVGAAIDTLPGLRLFSMPSNGLLPDRAMRLVEAIRARPRRPLAFLTFSVDGPEPVHDRVRGIPGGYRKTWETYERVRETVRGDRGFVVNVEVTVSRHNLREAGPFAASLLDAGHMVTVTFAHNAHLYVNSAKESVSPLADLEGTEAVLKALLARVPRWTPKGIVDRRYLRGVRSFARDPSRQVVPCSALESSVAIDAVGNVHPCLMWGRPLGNLRDHGYDLAAILAGAPAREARDLVRQEKCPNCWTPCEAYQSLVARAVRPLAR